MRNAGVELNKLIEDLINAIPDSVSTSTPCIVGEDVRPLKDRMKNPQEDIEHIKTDVRTCGLLVDDPAVPGTFKFGHKSFMEYLFASTIGNSILKPEQQQQDTKAILQVTKANIKHMIDLPVSGNFLLEIISQQIPSINKGNTKESYESYSLSITKFLFERIIKIKKINFLFRFNFFDSTLIRNIIVNNITVISSFLTLYFLIISSYSFLVDLILDIYYLYDSILYIIITIVILLGSFLFLLGMCFNIILIQKRK